MRFGAVPVGESVGAIAAHGLHVPGASLRKGEAITAAAARDLEAAGVREVVVAQLDPGDVTENEAARALAESLAGPSLRVEKAFTGRANLFAVSAGVLTVDTAAVDAINAVDESITIATLPPFRAVELGEMVATVKIIPFAVPGPALAGAIRAGGSRTLAVAPFQPLRVAVISTVLPGLKASVVDKTLRVMDARLAPAGARAVTDLRIPHEAEALASALRRHTPEADLVVVFGASAITDRRDVIPAGLVMAGGEIDHFGMPVDPGNLLLVGRLNGTPVLGAPGCARSPKENGFDWILQRLLAGLPVTASDIRKLGTGGLLMEIVSRPQPRTGEGGGTGEAAFEP